MTAAALRKWCLARSGAAEEFPFGEGVSVFKVAGKMFALSSLGARPLKVSLKCEPDLAHQLRKSYPAIQPGYHLNKRHWNTVTCNASVPDRLVKDMIEDSYDLVLSGLPASQRRAFGWRTDG